MRTARRQGVIRVVRCGTWPSSNVCARAPPVQYLRGGCKNVAYTRLKVDKDIMDALVHLNKKTGGKGRGGATTGDPVLETSLWAMLYADDVGAV